MEELTLPFGDDGDDRNGGGGGSGYDVACNLLSTGEGQGGLYAKYVWERLREWIIEEEEERRQRRSAEDGERWGSGLSSSSPCCYVEEAYRVGMTAHTRILGSFQIGRCAYL